MTKNGIKRGQMNKEVILWQFVGGIVGVLGATIGVIAGIIDLRNSRRIRNREESWFTLARWNPRDWFNFFLVAFGFSSSLAGYICFMLDVNWKVINLLLETGIVLLSIGAGRWISRARALMKKGGS